MNQIISTESPKAAAPQSIAEVRGALSFIRPQNTKPVSYTHLTLPTIYPV